MTKPLKEREIEQIQNFCLKLCLPTNEQGESLVINKLNFLAGTTFFQTLHFFRIKYLKIMLMFVKL